MEFIQNISIDQLADIGFGLLIAGVCIKTLFTDKNVQAKQRELWKLELHELEGSLKTLIQEASDASEVFDKNIRHRQKELSSLLQKIEFKITEARSISELSQPNKSLNKPSQNERHANSYPSEDPPWVHHSSKSKIQTEIIRDEILSSKKDMSPGKRPVNAQGKQDGQKFSPATDLRKQIEIERDEQEKIDSEIFQQTSIVDPVAFKIAKRLLLAGKELHIVARKLELPVSEIRHLDSLLRDQAQKENRPLPKALEEKEIRRVRGIVRDPSEHYQDNHKTVLKQSSTLLTGNKDEQHNEDILF